MGFSLVMSYMLQPMWLNRMVTSATPFLAVAMARGIFTVGDGLGRLIPRMARRITIGFATTVLAVGLAAGSVWAATRDLKTTNFPAAAREIRAGLRAGDVIFVPDTVQFWAIAWYLVGPDWGSPLLVQNPSISSKWATILHRLGPFWQRRLDLRPRTRMLSYDRATLVVGLPIPPIVAEAQRIWLVTETGYHDPLVEVLGFGFFVQRERQIFPSPTLGDRNVDGTRTTAKDPPHSVILRLLTHPSAL
jgi:hypothetical protein